MNNHLSPQCNNQADYYMPETMTFIYCCACLSIALQNSKEAREIYLKIIDCYRLPDIRNAVNQAMSEVDEDKTKIADKLSRSINKSKTSLPNALFLKDTKKVLMDYTGAFDGMLDLKKGKILSADFRLWFGLINELIRIGFNNKEEQAKGIFKLNSEKSSNLAFAIQIRSFAEYNSFTVTNTDEKKAFSISGVTYNITDLIKHNRKGRRQRQMTKRYKQDGYEQHHDDVILKKAWRWYQSRVVNTGPKAFCNKMLKQGCLLDISNISNDIKECDEALGYPRSIPK